MCEDCQNEKNNDAFIVIIKQFNEGKLTTIELLQKTQAIFGYISEEVSKAIVSKTNLLLTDIYSIITFYSEFKLSRLANYNIEICLGTACYVEGAEEIMNYISEKLKVKAGEITKDGKFCYHVARCFGCCSIAPVIKINGEIIGNVKLRDIDKILARCK